MSNVVNPELARAFARTVSARIEDPMAARRFEKLAFLRLIGDERNLRPVDEHEWAALPEWADRARRRGDALQVFALRRGAAQSIRIAARRLADVCAIASDARALDGRREAVRAARKFIKRISRMSFEAASRQAYAFSVLRRDWAEERDGDQICDVAAVAATDGRTWRRVTSLRELRAIGREFRNCLSNATRRNPHGDALVSGAGQFWVLRDSGATGLMIAFATCSTTCRFREVKGPRNQGIDRAHPDLLLLARALGVLASEPPPDPPTPPSPQTPRGRRAPRARLDEVQIEPIASLSLPRFGFTPLQLFDLEP